MKNINKIKKLKNNYLSSFEMAIWFVRNLPKVVDQCIYFKIKMTNFFAINYVPTSHFFPCSSKIK
jgi:hypothetical protein